MPAFHRWPEQSLRFVGGLAEGTETVIGYVRFCLFPANAAAIAWVFTAAVAIAAVQRVAHGVRVLRPPTARHPARWDRRHGGPAP